MILADTSIWINHLRWGDARLKVLLNNSEILIHHFIIGELSTGQLKNRKTLLELLNALPKTILAEHEEVLLLLESKKLFGRGLGWVDLHLLAAAIISGTPLWTRDKRLSEAARNLDISADSF